MIIEKVELRNKFGLHLRPAMIFASMARRFCSEIRVGYNGKIVTGKSVIALLQLEAQEGSIISLQIDGQDEREAMKALIQLINNQFETR